MRSNPATDAAFRNVYDATFDDVLRFCLRRLPVSDVNDAVADVYLVAWKKFSEIPDGREALFWLYGVARNVVRHTARGNRRRLRLTERAGQQPDCVEPDPGAVIVRHSEYDALATAIGRLTATDREVIRLRAWEDLTAQEMAAVLGCSVAAAEKRITRAFARLQKIVAAQDGATGSQAIANQEGGT